MIVMRIRYNHALIVQWIQCNKDNGSSLVQMTFFTLSTITLPSDIYVCHLKSYYYITKHVCVYIYPVWMHTYSSTKLALMIKDAYNTYFVCHVQTLGNCQVYISDKLQKALFQEVSFNGFVLVGYTFSLLLQLLLMSAGALINQLWFSLW